MDGKIVRWAWARESDLIPEPFWTSVYLIDGLLIDSGAPAGLEEFMEFVEKGNSRDIIEEVVLTHWHEDHSGGARYLTEELGLPVYIHENGLERVRNGFSVPNYRELAWGNPLEPAPKVEPLNLNSIDSPGGMYTFELLHIPGHSQDLIALIEPSKGWVFVSDSIVPNYQTIFNETGGELGESMEPVNEDIKQIFSSLKRLRDYTAEMDDFSVYSSYFGKFEDRKIIEENIEELESMHVEVHKLKRKGFNPQEIVEEIFGGEHITGDLTNGALSRLNLVNSLLEWSI